MQVMSPNMLYEGVYSEAKREYISGPYSLRKYAHALI